MYKVSNADPMDPRSMDQLPNPENYGLSIEPPSLSISPEIDLKINHMEFVILCELAKFLFQVTNFNL